MSSWKTTTKSGSWSDPSNWINGQVPTTASDVNLYLADRAVVTIDTAVTAKSLQFVQLGSFSPINITEGGSLTLTGAITLDGSDILGLSGGTINANSITSIYTPNPNSNVTAPHGSGLISGYGNINVSSGLDVSPIQAAGGTLRLRGSLDGIYDNVHLQILSRTATLDVSSTSIATFSMVQFQGYTAGGTLRIGTPDTIKIDQIYGFSIESLLVLSSITVSSVSFDGKNLTVTRSAGSPLIYEMDGRNLVGLEPKFQANSAGETYIYFQTPSGVKGSLISEALAAQPVTATGEASSFPGAVVTWIGESGNTYGLYKEPKTWGEAEQFARSLGAYIVKIDSESENREVFAAVSRNISQPEIGAYKAPDGGRASYVWLGASDAQTEGAWKWAKDGSALSTTRSEWGSGGGITEPDNSNNQDYLAMALESWPSASLGTGFTIGTAGKWNDIAGTNRLFFVLEKDGAASSTTTPGSSQGSFATSLKSYGFSSSAARVMSSDGGATWTVITPAGTETLTSSDRLRFSDKTIALDFDRGEAGHKAVTLIGAAFGKSYINQYFGTGLSLFDSGQSMAQIAQLVVSTGLIETMVGSSNSAWVRHVYKNVIGVNPDAFTEAVYRTYLDNGTYTKASLLELAAGVATLETQIDLVGIRAEGIEYVPFI
jgi:hypothetical protein